LFQSISPPFVASCTARVGSHGQQRICQVFWMYCWAARPKIPNPKLQTLKTPDHELQIAERQFF
jgi:hypothetical protein